MVSIIKKAILPVLLVTLSQFVSAQTYDIIIDNRALTSNNTMEFDVFIKSNGATGNWALRSYQSGYQFNSAFVNGGTLSGAYVSGSSDLESTFGTTWGFSYNATAFVLNQSSNTGSLCPGALMGTTARKIGRFRVTNTVNWGCADDNITIRTSGTGILTLAVTKYNSLDCSDVTNTAISSNATASTSTPNESILTASSSAPPSCTGNTSITVSATGGVSPYTGTGVFTVGNGTYNYTVTDNRGCTATTSIVVNISPITSSFSASGCSSYTLPWGTTVSSSGAYSNVYTSYQGCDSTVTANITIKSPTSSSTSLTICSTQLPYSWNGNSYTAGGTYSTTLVNAAGCDSVATLVLATNTPSTAPTSVSASALTITTGTSVNLTVNGGSLGTGASWKWYSGSCGGTAVGTGSTVTVTPGATTTYYVRAENVCGNTSCAIITITVNSASCTPSGITSTVAGNILCSGKSAILTVQGTLSSGAVWRWYRAACGGSTSIGSGASITVKPSSTTSYFVRQEGGTCGISGCASVTITVIAKPATPGTITGPATGLCNKTNISYSIASVPFTTYYTWYVPAGSTIVSGQGTNAIVVNFSNSISSTSICVTASNQCGTSSSKCLSISLIPQLSPNTITGPNRVSPNSTVTYSVTAAYGASNYLWIVPSGWQILSGVGTNSISVRTGASGGNVTVTPSNACGSGSTSSLSVRLASARPGSETPAPAPEITVWPVPAKDVLFLKHTGTQPHRIELFDSYGRLVMADAWTNQLELDKFPSGMYILKIYSRDGQTVTKRIEIIK